VSSIKCSPHVAGPVDVQASMIAQSVGLLAWLLALSAWDAGEPTSQEVFQAQTGRLRLVWWPSEGVGACGGPEKLIKMATCQRRRRLRLEAAVLPLGARSRCCHGGRH
jgi:hypothetical protein